MGIVDEDIVRVRQATDIVALITEHTQLRKVGSRWTGLCPFHSEKSPSFSVNQAEGLYYCFGCRVSGDAITFLRELEGLDFVEAVERLAAKSGIALTYTDRAESATRQKRQRLLARVEEAVEFYHQRLKTSPDVGCTLVPARSGLRYRRGGAVSHRLGTRWLGRAVQGPSPRRRDRNRHRPGFHQQGRTPAGLLSGAGVVSDLRP